MAISFEPITPAIGAIVSGIDLSEPLTVEDHRAVEDVLFDRQVLFLRDQSLTEAQHRDFAAHFGPLHIHPIYSQVAGVAEIIVLDSDQTDLADNATWHSDISFAEVPSLGGARGAPATRVRWGYAMVQRHGRL